MSIAAALVVVMIAGSPAVPSASATNYVTTVIPITSPTRPDPTPVEVLVDSANGHAYVANSFEGTVSVIDTTTHRVVATVPHGSSSVGDGARGLALDTKRSRLYVANYNSDSLSVVDTRTNGVIQVLSGVGSKPVALDIDAELNRLYVANLGDNSVTVVDTASGAVVTVLAHDSARGIGTFPTDVTVDPVLHRAYTANGTDGTVSVIDTRTNSVLTVIPHAADSIGDQPRQIAIDPLSHRAFVTNSRGGSVSVIDTTSNTVRAVLTNGVGDEPFSVAFDPVGRQFLVEAETQIAAIDSGSLRTVRVIATSRGNDLGQGLQWMAVDAPGRQAYVVGSASNTVAVIDLEGTAALSRRGGSDRFVVSAAVSAAEFASGTDVAYVATGGTFPDALSASAAAGVRSGPVLLVTRDSIPTPVGAELARLKPKRIVLLGGTAAVSPEVETALGSYAPVTRLAGADRFAVSAAVSRDAFLASPPVAYVASGENFPDALSGGAVAARADGPVLLVQRDGVPDAVRAELLRLQPAKIVLLGGEDAVSTSVAAALSAIAPTSRVAGADRFAVSAAVSASVFTAGAGTTYIASGTAFPDALSGGPMATANSAPVLLVRPDGIPDAIAAELRRLAPNRIVVLGGPAAVSPAVYEQLRDFLPR